MLVRIRQVVAVVMMPGWLLAKAVEETHAGDPIPGWMQYDDGIVEENGRVTKVKGKPIQAEHVYRVVTKVGDLTNGQSPSLTEYFTKNPDQVLVYG